MKKIRVKLAEPTKNTVHIVEVNDEAIVFDDGSRITFDHDRDCCEWNYADFEQLDDLARAYNFQLPLKFEAVNEGGFRFGDSRRMFFVPCYSDQNGYYTCAIDIYYTGYSERNEPVLSFDAKALFESPYDEFAFIDDDCGFDLYMGCYTDDC